MDSSPNHGSFIPAGEVYHDLGETEAEISKNVRKLVGLSKGEADKTNFNIRTTDYVPRER